MFGINRPAFIVGSSSLFSKKRLTPVEFGREATRLGFSFGVAQFGQYQSAGSKSQADVRLLNEVRRNPGIMQLLFSNLVAGAFLCHARMSLRATEKVSAEVEEGVLVQLRSTMPQMSPHVLQNHKDITVNFAIAIEREMRQIEAESSTSLLLSYINDLYPEFGSGVASALPSGLFAVVSGLGSRFAAVCQDDFKITLSQA